MKRKNISNELKCKIKVIANKTAGTRVITAQCTSQNEVLVAIEY